MFTYLFTYLVTKSKAGYTLPMFAGRVHGVYGRPEHCTGVHESCWNSIIMQFFANTACKHLCLKLHPCSLLTVLTPMNMGRKHGAMYNVHTAHLHGPH